MNTDLNKRIAIEVMGLKPFEKKWESGAHSGFLDSWLDENNKEVSRPLPNYSGNIEAAWEVVNKLTQSRACCFELKWYVGESPWECKISFSDGEHHPTYEAGAFTPPEAICLAALKALEKKDE